MESQAGVDSAAVDPEAPPRCTACGEVIGVYEPYMLVTDDELEIGSRAANPLSSAGALLYHLGCYEPR